MYAGAHYKGSKAAAGATNWDTEYDLFSPAVLNNIVVYFNSHGLQPSFTPFIILCQKLHWQSEGGLSGV